MLSHFQRIFARKTALYLASGILIFVLIYTVTANLFDQHNKPFEKKDALFQQLKIMPPKLKDQLDKVENYIKRGDTIINTLKREGLDHQSAYQFVADVKPVYDLKRIGAGKKYTLFLSKKTGELQRFRYEIDVNQYFNAWKDQDTSDYKGRIVTIPYKVKREFINGEIQESLFASILDIGEKAELADIMASLYEYDIDFNRDIRKKDTYALVVEKMYLRGQFARYGHILAAEFTNRGKTIQVIRYTDPEGKTAYYHPDGRSVRKMFLRCPLPFMRLTSRYGNRRHPLLGFSARHHGIDLAAPRGTRVRATASGIVLKTGYTSRKGKFISIRHRNRYVTHYYHLSRFAKGVRRGKRVEQGQIIGYVGRTGWATGPHLHYGMQKNRRFINPLRLKSPTKEPVKKKYLQAFKQYTAKVFLLLSGSRLVKIPDSLTEALFKTPVRQTPQPSQPAVSPITSINRQ
ncbi:MAG: peptidoglycan DD-metalloendopeptidase family protein [Candidatus Aminicenantes bacterium]|nr:peptidoglycan DD-metalloendopeptidase family protein [Candidatus Aminicenantes bacterium]